MEFQNEHLSNLRQSVGSLRNSVENHVNELGDQATFADRFMLASAQSQQDFLEEVAANEAPLIWEALEAQEVAPHLLFDAQAVLTGDPIVAHQVPIKLLGEFLVSFQDVVTNLGRYAAFNSKITDGAQRVVVPQNQIMCAGMFAGSFGVGLRVAPDNVEESEQMELFSEEKQEIPNQALELLHLLLDGNTDRTQLRESLTQARVKSNYQKLVTLLAKQGASVAFSTKDKPQPAVMTTEQASALVFWLESLQIKESVEIINGVLNGGSLEYDRFEIRIDENTLIKGRMTAEAAKDFQRLTFGSPVRAIVQVSVATNSDTGTEKISYVLQRATPPDELLAFE